MKENAWGQNSLAAKLNSAREKYLPYNEATLRRLATVATVMFALVLIWALLLKCGMEQVLITNYLNLKGLTLEERIMWDIIPFNYRGDGAYKARLIMDTLLNCFVFAPLGVGLCYIFKKQNLLRNAAICLGFSVLIEMLQLLTMLGNPATEDLITNVVGCFIGYGIYHLLFKRLSAKQGTWFLAAVNAVFAVAVIFSIVTTIAASDVIFKIFTRTL